MKTDEIPFTFVTAIVLAGALLAVVSPSKQNVTATAPTTAVVAHSETAPSDITATELSPTAESEVTE